jgi:hypothetical protein
MRKTLAWAAALAMTGGIALADPISAVQSSSNMQIVGHSDLNGAGHGGEGLALRQYPDGRRVLFLAHESAPMCVSIIDVTKPEDPKVITQISNPAPQLRCNSLGLSGTTMTVAHQTDEPGQLGGGMEVWDVADPAHPKQTVSTPPARIRAGCTICGSRTAIMPICQPGRRTLRRRTSLTTSSS